MNKFSKYVGLDVHQKTIAAAVADIGGEVRYIGEIVNTPEAGEFGMLPLIIGGSERRTHRSSDGFAESTGDNVRRKHIWQCATGTPVQPIGELP